MVRRYGSESEFGGVWRLSEMKSREEGNRYKATKLDMMLPGHPVLYSLIKLENNGEEALRYNVSMHAVLAPPFIESGSLINTSGAEFVAFPPNLREVAFNRLKSGTPFSDLKHAPSLNGGSIDMAYIPGPNGSYDYIMGKISEQVSTGYLSVINPKQQLIYLSFFPAIGDTSLPDDVVKCSNIDLAFNYAGRMDTPYALYEGGTPQVFTLTAGFGCMDDHGAFNQDKNCVLLPGESKTFLSGHAFTSFDNPRISGGFYSVEKADHGLVCKRTKSYAYIQADYSFTVIRNLASRLLSS